jgi:hypothetical protein
MRDAVENRREGLRAGPANQDDLPPLTCPNCRAAISLLTVRWRRSFVCGKCRAILSVPKRYLGFLSLLMLGLSTAAAYVGGARGGFLILWAPALFIPIAMVGGLFYRILFPPSLMEVSNPAGNWSPLGSPDSGGQDDDPDPSALVSDDSASLLQSPLIAGASFAVTAGFVAPFIDQRTLPLAKWFVFFGAAMLAWAGGRVFPDVWENRRDDKTAIFFVAALVLCMLGVMWDSLHWR